MQTIASAGAPSLLVAQQRCVWVGALTLAGTVAWFTGLLVGIMTIVGSLAFAVAVARERHVRTWLERSARAGAWRERAKAREATLEDAGAPVICLRDTTRLAWQLATSDPDTFARLNVEALLDRYVDLELCANQLERSIQASPTLLPATYSARRTEVRMRRVRLRYDTEARLRVCRDELVAIDELIELLLAKSGLRGTEIDGDPIAERLALLPDDDALDFRQLPSTP